MTRKRKRCGDPGENAGSHMEEWPSTSSVRPKRLADSRQFQQGLASLVTISICTGRPHTNSDVGRTLDVGQIQVALADVARCLPAVARIGPHPSSVPNEVAPSLAQRARNRPKPGRCLSRAEMSRLRCDTHLKSSEAIDVGAGPCCGVGEGTDSGGPEPSSAESGFGAAGNLTRPGSSM